MNATITEGTTVRGYLRRADGKHVYFAGTVAQVYSLPVHGFGVACVKVIRADTGRPCYTHMAEVEAIEERPAADRTFTVTATGYVITNGMVAQEIARTQAAHTERPAPAGPSMRIRSITEMI